MAIASNNEFPSVLFVEGTTPSSPGAGKQRLFVRSSDHILCLVNSAGAVAPISSPLLGYKANTSGDESTGGATLADVDATNAAVAFTAPASTNVLVRLTGVVSPGTTNNAYVSWGLREASSDIAGAVGESIAVRAAGSAGSGQFLGASVVFVLLAISAGAHTYKWSHACSSGTGTLKANASAPSVMEVWALP